MKHLDLYAADQNESVVDKMNNVATERGGGVSEIDDEEPERVFL